jgi:AcrR family transcriptional regulator
MRFEHSKDAFRKLSQEKQDKILTAAVNEFAEYGFDSAILIT